MNARKLAWVSYLFDHWQDLTQAQRETLARKVYQIGWETLAQTTDFEQLSHTTRQDVAKHLAEHKHDWPLK